MTPLQILTLTLLNVFDIDVSYRDDLWYVHLSDDENFDVFLTYNVGKESQDEVIEVFKEHVKQREQTNPKNKA